MPNATKVAISLPKDLYRAVERARKKNGTSRSSVVQEALRCWLKQKQEARWIREYVEGYRRKPESRREIEAAEAAAVELFAAVEW